MCAIADGIGWAGTFISIAGLAVFIMAVLRREYVIAFAAAILISGTGLGISYLPYRYVISHDRSAIPEGRHG
jgi:hypothetical protein